MNVYGRIGYRRVQDLTTGERSYNKQMHISNTTSVNVLHNKSNTGFDVIIVKVLSISF